MAQMINILFVDDQWCRPRDRSMIVAEYGPLQQREIPYVFHYETAEDGKGRYSIEPVLRKIEAISGLGAVVLDIMFGDSGNRLGLEILEAIRETYPILPVFMMTSLDNSIDAIERAMELGANEYLIKKPTLKELETVLRTYCQPSAQEADYAIWGNSPAIRSVRALIAKVAIGGSASVLITGESGTGKELIARAIHRQGPRRRGPFIDKNCAYEKSDLLDDDLFGHEKGGFTDAIQQHTGRIERANGGVLFLDEIGDMSSELQGKLLRVLETKCFQRIGGTDDVNSDFQLICATNKDPGQMVADGILREDLFYRIKQLGIHAPLLRQRVADIPILANLFLRRFKTGSGASYPALKLSAEVLKVLEAYPWPGNVRELRNVVERAVILSRKLTIDLDCLPPEIVGSREGEECVQSLTALSLPASSDQWPRQRLLAELEMALEAKKRVKEYKGKQWKAEFMRLMYPECKAQNAKGFNDLIRRLTKGPWGKSDYHRDPELAALIDELQS